MKTNLPRRWGLFWLTGIATIVIAMTAFASPPAASESAIDDETCLGCHDQFEASPGNHAGEVSCASCHTGAAVHADDPSPDNIFIPTGEEAQRSTQLCSGCHNPHPGLDNVGFDPMLDQGYTCTQCHSVHKDVPAVTPDEFCGKCHVSMTSQFMQRSNHPVTGGTMGCLDCHSSTGQVESSIGHGTAITCENCHADYSGPYLYEHEATSSFSTEGGGCTTCHNAHGSVNDRLLTQSADNLCRQCHGLPPLHRITHEGIGEQYGCIDCHSEIHGSNHNGHLLDPQLGSKLGSGPDGCFCHNVYE